MLVVFLPFVFLVATTAWKVRFGLELADESFLWYGAQRTALGEVPMRDFQSYDPGRYYWTALFMWLSRRDGVLVSRWASVTFEAIAIALGSLAFWHFFRSVTRSLVLAICCVVLAHTWAGRFEPSMALLQVAALALFCEKRSWVRAFAVGATVGVSAFMGRNLALYGSVGLVLALAAISFLERKWISPQTVLAVLLGGLAGSAPLWGMLLFVPGFAGTFWHSIEVLFRSGATNIALPIPWPWAISYAQLPAEYQASAFSQGVFFAALPIPMVLVTGAVLTRRSWVERNPLFLAAALLSAGYAHYAYSRADLPHLSRAGIPLLVALAAVAALARRPVLRSLPALGSAALLACVMWTAQDSGGAPALRSPSQMGQCVELVVRGDRLCVQPGTAAMIQGVASFVSRFVGPGDSYFVAPYDLGIHAALGTRAPNYFLYPILPSSEEDQLKEIGRLEAHRTRLAVISGGRLDGRADLSFDVTHPLIVSYLLDRLAPLDQKVLPPWFVVLAPR